jgi:subtilisin family serine protease
VKRAALAAVGMALFLPGVVAARPGFTPSDPLAPRQYYLTQDHAFDAFGDALPILNPVRVAIIDSGLDKSHPEFQPGAKRIWAARTFVATDWDKDEQGHGTFIAGEIAAAINNNEGIAGIAFPAQLIIAKIAGPEGTIDIKDEAAAIRWAADRGAQVINLSIGGLRDPTDSNNDMFSPTEARAIEYAYRHGAVIVAAVGNSDEAPRQPWPWASYPAALPHVIGVSALTQTGNIASFSDRDRIYNDLSAPGQDIFSTLPFTITKLRPTCIDQGYSDCGPDLFKHASGTSFAAPQVSAAAAVLIALRPSLKPDQVSNILERTATDVNASNGCGQCPPNRDLFTGWGRLDIAKAIAALGETLPPVDRLEPNDDAGSHAPVLPPAVRQLKATLDFWDDQIDVYKTRLAKGRVIRLGLDGPSGATSHLLLWKPGTKRVNDLRRQNLRAAQSTGKGSSHKLSYRARASGWYYIEVKLATKGFGAYTLTLTRK